MLESISLKLQLAKSALTESLSIKPDGYCLLRACCVACSLKSRGFRDLDFTKEVDVSYFESFLEELVYLEKENKKFINIDKHGRFDKILLIFRNQKERNIEFCLPNILWGEMFDITFLISKSKKLFTHNPIYFINPDLVNHEVYSVSQVLFCDQSSSSFNFFDLINFNNPNTLIVHYSGIHFMFYKLITFIGHDDINKVLNILIKYFTY